MPRSCEQGHCAKRSSKKGIRIFLIDALKCHLLSIALRKVRRRRAFSRNPFQKTLFERKKICELCLESLIHLIKYTCSILPLEIHECSESVLSNFLYIFSSFVTISIGLLYCLNKAPSTLHVVYSGLKWHTVSTLRSRENGVSGISSRLSASRDNVSILEA